VTVTSKRRKEPVILWGDEFCSWIGVLEELGLCPAAVILSSMDAIHLVKGVVGIECFVGTASDLEAVLLPSLRGKCRLGLVDGRVTGKLCEMATQLNLSRLIETTCVQRKVPGWENDSMTLRHCEVGGITTTLTQGCCLTRGKESLTSEPIQVIVSRDASTVLSPTAPSRKYQPKPKTRVVLPLGCENLGSEARPHYHGGGLLPATVDRKTSVLTPGVYAPKDSWAL
jgi:hypothetical protein